MTAVATPEKAPYILVEHWGAYTTLLRAAFDQVCDPFDWKAPVDCMVPWEGAAVYVQAVEFMTAIKPSCVHVVKDGKSFARIKCDGYHAGPAGP